MLYCFLFVINFSVEKLNVYFVVECFNHEIKIVNVFNFIGIYKGKGVFLLMVFSYFQNLDLNFNNFHG